MFHDAKYEKPLIGGDNDIITELDLKEDGTIYI
jgi:hypothetical protein